MARPTQTKNLLTLHFRALALFLAGVISASTNSTGLIAPTGIRIGGSGGALATMQIFRQAFTGILNSCS